MVATSLFYCLASHLGQVKGGEALRIDQPHSRQVSIPSPSIQRIMGPLPLDGSKSLPI